MNGFVAWVLERQEVLILAVAALTLLGLLLTRRGRHHR